MPISLATVHRPLATGLMDVRDAILKRRTRKAWGGEPVARAVLEELLELARWAPNHRLTNPWRFAVLDQPALRRLHEFVEANAAAVGGPKPGGEESVRAKARQMLPTMGALIVVGCAADPNPKIHREDLLACAAACQNILLGATSRGLASFWSTGALLASEKSKEFYGWGGDIEIVGAICLGSPVGDVPTSQRESLDGKVTWT